MFIPKNRTFIISSGCYSNYDVQTICVAKQDIDVNSLKSEFDVLWEKEYQQREDEWRYNKFTIFIHFLINQKNVVDELEYSEFHIGDYSGDIDLSLRKERGYWRDEEL